jgi:GBF-interacting protein 1 N-terminal
MSGKVAAAAASAIPSSARKLVQSLKEIVNRPESEIYATLKECDMDPDAALDRLLTQGFCFSDQFIFSVFLV